MTTHEPTVSDESLAALLYYTWLKGLGGVGPSFPRLSSLVQQGWLDAAFAAKLSLTQQGPEQ